MAGGFAASAHWALSVDAWLGRRPAGVRALAIGLTLVVMLAASLPQIPRPFLDYRQVPLLSGMSQPETYGTDTIADMYEAKVVLNDVGDMYTKARLDQTPLEAATWSKEASAPYPPAVLLAEAALYAVGERTGVGLYGMVLALAIAFVGLSLWYCLRTRWYLFPLLYLNCSYFSTRFVSVQDGSYLVMLTTVIAALLLVRSGRTISHVLVALATTMKVSPFFYAVNLGRMRRPVAIAFVAILLAGLVLPYFVWDNYLYIFRFNDGVKGHWYDTVGAAALAIPFGVVLAYVQARLPFDWEDRIGWGLVPVALFLGFKMNVARHLMIVLLIPDRRVLRTAAAAVGLALPAAFPAWIRFNAALPITAGLLALVLAEYVRQIGGSTVRADWRRLRDRVSASVEETRSP